MSRESTGDLAGFLSLRISTWLQSGDRQGIKYQLEKELDKCVTEGTLILPRESTEHRPRSSPMIEGLPQWRCHKVVGAFKIHDIKPCPPGMRENYYRVYPELTMADKVPIVEVPQEVFRAREHLLRHLDDRHLVRSEEHTSELQSP